MQPGGSLSWSQVPAIGPYPEWHESNQGPSIYFFNIHFNIILPSKPTSSSSLLPSGFPTKIL